MIARRLMLVLSALAAAALLAACGGSDDKKTDAPTVPADAVAIVDGKTILKADYDHLIAVGLASFKARQQPEPKAGTPEYETLKQQAMQILFQRLIITTEAEKQGLKVDTKKVEEELAKLKEQAGDDAAWKKQLADAGATEEDYRSTFAVQQLSQALYEKLTKQTPVVTEDDIAKKYAADKETVYLNPESRKVVHILIGAEDGSSPDAGALAKYKKTAESVIAQLEKGADFAKLVDKYSTDPGKTENKGEYDVTPTGFDEAFTKASYDLETGEFTTAPVKSQFGYHIIKALEDKTPESYKPLTEVSAQIKSQLEQERKDKSATDWFVQIQKTYEGKAAFATGYGLPAPVDTTASTGTVGTTAPATTG
jgi:parvulin-like peptidyl-prolyl isomerase